VKKYILLTLIIILALSLCSCMNTKNETGEQEIAETNGVNTDMPEMNKVLDKITVTADVNPGTPREDMKEVFFEDESYIYSFNYPQSSVIKAFYTDGSEQNVKDALNDGNITISDLDRFNISYCSEKKSDKINVDNDVLLKSIDIPDNVKSINVKYEYGNTHSTKTILLTEVKNVTRLCTDFESLKLVESTGYLKETVRLFEITFYDENFNEVMNADIWANDGISIDKKSYFVKIGELETDFLVNLFSGEKKVDNITVNYVSECDVEEPFYEDDVYIYSFGNPQSDYTVVKYTDGSCQRLKEALTEGNVKIPDLDTFGIKYYTEIKPVDNPEITYQIGGGVSDYTIPTDLTSMIEEVDLVIVGMYDGTLSTYATEIGQIYSIGRVSDYYILKGEASLEPKEITFYGGALPISEFMKYVRPDISANRGFDKLTKLEADTKYVGVPVTQYSANPIEGTRYMFLLSYDESTGEYFVACDGYGAREISTDGTGVWNPDTEEFEPFFLVNEN